LVFHTAQKKGSMNNLIRHTSWVVLAIFLSSCSAKNISSSYYFEHQDQVEKIEESYKAIYKRSPFTLAFADKQFRIVTLDILTDSMSYIYEFEVDEPRLNDTLLKYHLPVTGVNTLIHDMLAIHCTWVNNFDYYVDEKKRSTIFLSIKPTVSHPFLSDKRYYILTFFNQPQYFDEQGRLVDKRKAKRIRKINGEIFHRITDKVCYTVSSQFR